MASVTGAITGTPTAASSAATYTVTVTDANSATATATFSLTVNGAVVATQAIATKTLTKGGGGGVVHSGHRLRRHGHAELQRVAELAGGPVDGLGHRRDHRDSDGDVFGDDLHGQLDRCQQRNGDGDLLADGQLRGCRHPSDRIEDVDAEQGGGGVHPGDGLGRDDSARLYGVAEPADRSVDGIGHRRDHRDGDGNGNRRGSHRDGHRRQRRFCHGELHPDRQ